MKAQIDTFQITIQEKDPFFIRCEKVFLYTLAFYLGLLFIQQTELRIMLPEIIQKGIQVLRYLCYLLFLIKIVAERLYRRQYLFSVILSIICVALCVFSSGTRTIIFTALVIIAGYNCNWRKVLKIATIVFATGLIITLILCKVGVFQDLILDESRARHNLGFNWVTIGPIYLFFITIGYVNVIKRRISWIEAIILGIGSYLLYKATDTRMTFLLSIGFLLIVIIQQRVLHSKWRMIRFFRRWIWLLPIVICLIVLFIQIMYKPGVAFWDKMNSLLSDRLNLTYQNMQTLPVTIFGESIQWSGFSLGEGLLELDSQFVYNNVDSSYWRILYDYGIVGLLLTITVYVLGMKKAAKEDNPLLLWGYIVVLLFCVTEQWMMELTFNPLPLVAIAGLFTIRLYDLDEIRRRIISAFS